jgi:nucleoside-diphosphate-sugar epimerase
VATLIVGCGYLGRRVGRLLSGRVERVFGTTRSAARASELAAWGVEPVVADVLDPDSLRRLPEAERVLYCVGFDRSASVPLRAVAVDGLTNVLNALSATTARLTYVSSTGVYGQTDGSWIDEASPASPRSESGRASLEAEATALRWGVETGRAVSVVRFSGLYGPGRVIRRALLERGEPIPGDPDHFLNLIHIDDAAVAAVAVLGRGAPGRIYLASDDRPVTRRDYYTLAARRLGAPAPRFEPSGTERGESNKRVANHRIKQELGLRLAYPDVTSGLAAALSEG